MKNPHGRIWALNEWNGQIMSIYNEAWAARCAEKYPDTIYFFATLSMEDE